MKIYLDPDSPGSSPGSATDPAPPEPTPPGGGDDLSQSVETAHSLSPDPNLDAILHDREEREKAERIKREMEREKGKKGKKGKPSSSLSNTTDDTKKKVRDEAFRARCRKSGKATIDCIVLTCGTLFGLKWFYQKGKKVFTTGAEGETQEQDEKEYMREEWANVFEEYEWETRPSWIGLVVTLVAYTGARLQEPEYKPKVNHFKTWLSNVMSSMWGGKKRTDINLKAGPAAGDGQIIDVTPDVKT